jgi:hypothetical protein
MAITPRDLLACTSSRHTYSYGRFAMTVGFACLATVAPLSAQPSPGGDPLTAQTIQANPVEPPARVVVVPSAAEMLELEQWTRDFAAWQKWADRWLNRRQPGRWSYLVERNKKPDPPAWLPGLCELLADDEQFASSCELLASWREDPIAARNRQSAAAVPLQKERPGKTSWWQHMHVDGLWSTTQSNMAAFGLFGTHFTIEVEGRLHVFAAPGILLVSAPNFSGARDLWPALDWGVTYRLFHVGKNTVHFNLVHAWMLKNRQNLVNPNVTLAGFSVSFGPRSR